MTQSEASRPFLVPSPFMASVVIPDHIKIMDTLQIAQKLRYESEKNSNRDWNEHEPEKCCFRQLVIELGNRIYGQIEPEEWGDWKDEVCCLLTGLAGYDAAWAFQTKRMAEVEAEVWDSLESFLKN